MNTLEKFEIVIDMLDRVQGTALYNIQKKLYGYSDSEYWEAVTLISEIYLALLNKKEQGE